MVVFCRKHGFLGYSHVDFYSCCFVHPKTTDASLLDIEINVHPAAIDLIFSSSAPIDVAPTSHASGHSFGADGADSAGSGLRPAGVRWHGPAAHRLRETQGELGDAKIAKG